ncbi:MAG: hypothetical protein IKE01_04000 [Clostridia bacterium]|nr:hypothetical protein [Clostridia bacterium]
MASSMTVVKNPDKDEKINLDFAQCNIDKNRGKDSLSVKMLNRLKIRENDRPPKIDKIETNKIGKKDKDWIRVEVVVTKEGKKNKSLGKVESNYYRNALNKKLELARRKAQEKGGRDHA